MGVRTPVHLCSKKHSINLKKEVMKTKLTFLLMLFFCAHSVWGQSISIKGKVISEKDNEPIVGVSVLIKGGAGSTITNVTGEYALKADANATLVFSYIGFVPQEIAVNGRTQIDVTLQEKNQALDEVVVVGYGTQKKSDVTGAIASVNDRTLKEIPAANFTQALQGRVVGIDIGSLSTKPGAESQIRIRGTRSLTATNDPLIVLDGIPFSGGLNDINPGDIKSMDFLKDASSTAIYGARGANGVILITTYRGEKGKARISYSGNYGIGSVLRKYHLFNAQEYMAMKAVAGYPAMAIETANLAAGVDTDWQDLFYQQAHQMQHDVTVSGGTDDVRYSIGLGNYNQTSVVPGQEYNRFSFHSSLDADINKWFKIGMTVNNTYGVTDGYNTDVMYSVLSLSPVTQCYNADGSLNIKPMSPQEDTYNPLLINNHSLWQDRTKRLSSFNSAYAEIKFLPELKYHVNAGFNYVQSYGGRYYSKDSPIRAGAMNQAVLSNNVRTTWTVENLLYYDKEFGDHKLNLTGMFSAEESEYEASTFTAYGIMADYIGYSNLSLYDTEKGGYLDQKPTGNYNKYSMLSSMFRANYGYKNRYMLTLTGRADGSSRLVDKWHAYGAVSGAWNINNEDFAHWDNVDMLKLRVGFGQTASQAVDPYSTFGTLSSNMYNYGTVHATGYYVSGLANNDLGWESTNTYNAGIDYSFFSGRLKGTLEGYIQKTHDLLLRQNLPSSSGVPNAIMKNIGSTQNQGIEFTVGGDIIQKKDLNWHVDVNMFMNRNKITALASGAKQEVGSGWFVGQPIDVVYDVEKIGIWQTADTTLAKSFNRKPGQIRVRDYDNDGNIDNDDRHILGSFEPKLQGGFSTRVDYKGFDFSVIGSFKVGGMLYSNLYTGSSYLNCLNGRRNQLYVDYWTPTNPTNKYPKPDVISDQPDDWPGTLGYFKAGFLRIRTITLGYSIPSAVVKSMGLSNLRAYCTVNNPFLPFFNEYVNKYDGLDCESNQIGGNGVGTNYNVQNRQLSIGINTPAARTFLFGVNVSF
jgi:TonB-linked SusC/RagA family outer membrane protein